jgi:hypothetical protein
MEAPVTLRWEEGRVVLPGGATLDVTTRGADAGVRWSEEALELHTLSAGGPSGAAPGATADGTIELVVRHSLALPDHAWVPHLTPEPGNVIGDAVFRSPAVVLADASIALALIVDLDDVRAASGWRAWLDCDHPRSTITLAAGAYREEGHVFFVRQPWRRTPGQAVLLRLHVVASTRAEDRENPYGMAARWLWERWGRPGHARAAVPPMRRYAEHVVRWAFSSDGWADSVWQPIDVGGVAAAAPVFIVDVTRHPSIPLRERRWREPRSIWNQAWFSTQRCANGLLRHARRVSSVDLDRRARQMTEIALAAPSHDGLFPSVLVASESGPGPAWRWSNSDRRPPSVSENACHLVDAAWTCRMLLEWHSLTGEPRALGVVRRFVRRLAALQRPSGAFPGWVEPDGRVPLELAEGPESAVSVALLLELAALGPDAGSEAAVPAAELRESARRGLSFLEGVVREGRWEDFETYYSCAPWGAPEMLGRRVPRNGVYKQNTLSIAWCAEAFLHGWRATRAPSYLLLARRCLDELSLYQAVWDPPWLPAPAHGGFGVMNADCEWNDARQSLFAPLYLELGRETGDRELTERGMSALRASFSMMYCPENAALARAYEQRFPFFGPESYGFMMENQGHNVSEPIGTFTIYAWGNGSALAAAAKVRDTFPELARECGLE